MRGLGQTRQLHFRLPLNPTPKIRSREELAMICLFSLFFFVFCFFGVFTTGIRNTIVPVSFGLMYSSIPRAPVASNTLRAPRDKFSLMEFAIIWESVESRDTNSPDFVCSTHAIGWRIREPKTWVLMTKNFKTNLAQILKTYRTRRAILSPAKRNKLFWAKVASAPTAKTTIQPPTISRLLHFLSNKEPVVLFSSFNASLSFSLVSSANCWN